MGTPTLALVRARSGPASARGIQLQGIVPVEASFSEQPPVVSDVSRPLALDPIRLVAGLVD